MLSSLFPAEAKLCFDKVGGKKERVEKALPFFQGTRQESSLLIRNYALPVDTVLLHRHLSPRATSIRWVTYNDYLGKEKKKKTAKI